MEIYSPPHESILGYRSDAAQKASRSNTLPAGYGIASDVDQRRAARSIEKEALKPRGGLTMGAFTESTAEEAALSRLRELGYAIGPAQLDDEGNLHVCIDGLQFCAGEKYTILELGWAVYLAEDKVPGDWMLVLTCAD